MKKFLSLALVLTMILALIAAMNVSVLAAFGEGEWDVYTKRGQYKDPDNPDKKPIPGYEYTTDGLHMIPADWSESTPWGIFQTKEQVDLRQGVYMEVRIDNFTYSGDKWFAFNIWEEKIDEFPYEDDKQALGFEALMRPDAEKKVSGIQFNSHTEAGMSTDTSSTGSGRLENKFDENGCPILTLQISWDEGTGYAFTFNGYTLDTNYSKMITDFFDGENNDGCAYISFSLQNGTKGGTAECTVLKFGTSPENCSTPIGTDRAEPIDNKIVIADIADPDSVPMGEPAIFVNGSVTYSDLLAKPRSTNNSTITIGDDDSINLMTSTSWASISMSIDHDVSYDAADFPVMMIIVRNMCTCVWEYGEPYCECVETPKVIVMAGDVIAEDSQHSLGAVTYMSEPFYDSEDNMYVNYFVDWSDYSGRINGFRFDLQGMKTSEEGRNNFDICNITFFRDYDDADRI